MSSKQDGDRRVKGGSRKPRRKDPPAASPFGFPDWDSAEYRSTTTVHLWDLGNAYTRGFRPPDGDWGRMMIHIFTHEPLHHAIGLCLAEMLERGDQEWVIARLGDARWW